MTAPWPWSVRYQQYSAGGKPSRPRIYDALGKKVSFSRKGNAELAALAPQLADCLARLAERTEFLMLMLQAEHPAAKEPDCLPEAQALVWLFEMRARFLPRERKRSRVHKKERSGS